MTIQERIDAIQDWIGGNVGHRPSGAGQWETFYDAMALERLLRQHLEGAFDDGITEAEKDFQHRIPWPTHERTEPL